MTKRRDHSSSRRSGPDAKVLGAVAAVVAVIALVVVIVVTMGDTDGGPPEFGSVEVDGTALPAVRSGPDTAVGRPAPSFLSDGPGGAVSVTPGDGTPHVLFFLAHWCPYCRQEVPELVDMWTAGDFEGVEATAVLIGTDVNAPNYPPSDWLDDAGWEGPRAYDDEVGTLAHAYGATGLPFIVFVDGDGSVVARMSGLQSASTIRSGLDAIRG